VAPEREFFSVVLPGRDARKCFRLCFGLLFRSCFWLFFRGLFRWCFFMVTSTVYAHVLAEQADQAADTFARAAGID